MVAPGAINEVRSGPRRGVQAGKGTGLPPSVASHDARPPFPLEALGAWPHPAARPHLFSLSSLLDDRITPVAAAVCALAWTTRPVWRLARPFPPRCPPAPPERADQQPALARHCVSRPRRSPG